MTSQQVKLVLLGDSGVGKTSIVQRFVYNNYKTDAPPTIGASFMSKVVEIPQTSQTIKFQIWDTAGQEKYKSLASMYYKDASAAILVYDITNKSSFDAIQFWVKELRENVSEELVLAIAGNKADLIEQEEITIGNAQKFATDMGAIFKQTSAKENIGVEDIFMNICMELKPDLRKKGPENGRPGATSTRGGGAQHGWSCIFAILPYTNSIYILYMASCIFHILKYTGDIRNFNTILF